MREVINHISSQKISTACTTDFKNTPDTLGFTPSLLKILNRRSQIFLYFHRLPTNVEQLPSKVVMIHPKYLKDVTYSSGLPQSC